jgi:hypothetical protein
MCVRSLVCPATLCTVELVSFYSDIEFEATVSTKLATKQNEANNTNTNTHTFRPHCSQLHTYN